MTRLRISKLVNSLALGGAAILASATLLQAVVCQMYPQWYVGPWAPDPPQPAGGICTQGRTVTDSGCWGPGMLDQACIEKGQQFAHFRQAIFIAGVGCTGWGSGPYDYTKVAAWAPPCK
jgi:hypothetical protein